MNFEADPSEVPAPGSGGQPAENTQLVLRGDTERSPLSENYLGAITPVDAARAALLEQIERIGTARGKLRADFPLNLDALTNLDLELRKVVEDARSIIPHNDLIFKSACELGKESNDEARLNAMEEILRKEALECGLAQGKVLNQAEVDRHRVAISNYCTHHADIFHRYPDLKPVLDGILAIEEQRGIQMRLDAEKLAMTISIAVRRLMPDVKTLHDALDKKTPLEIQLIKEAFEQRYSETIEHCIQDRFSRSAVKKLMPADVVISRTESLLKGDHLAATADALYLAIVGRFKKPFRAVCEILRNAPPEIIAELPKAFEDRHGAKRDKFEKAFKNFTLAENSIILSLLHGRTLEADAYSIKRGLEGKPGKYNRIYEILEKYGDKNLGALEEAYRNLFSNASLKEDLKSMKPSPGRDRVNAFLAQDQDKFLATKVACALNRIGTVSILDMFQENDKAGRDVLIKAYERVYNTDFWGRILKKCKDSDFFLLRAYHIHDQVPKVETIWHCVDGGGTDENGLRRALNGMTAKEIEALSAEFKAISGKRSWHRIPQKMSWRLKWETSGDAWHDVKRLLKGVPEDVHQMHERLLSTHKHERSGSLIRKIDWFSKEGAVMDADVARASEYYQSIVKDRTPTPEEKKRFETLVRFANRDFTAFRITKNDWSDTIANLGVIAASLGSFPFALMYVERLPLSIYWQVALVALTMGGVRGASRTLLSLGLKGNGYGREEMVRHFILTLIETGTFFMSKFFPSSFLRRPIDMGAKMGLKTIVRLGETSDTFRTPAHALTIRDLHRSIDDDWSAGPSEEIEGGLVDNVDCVGDVCSIGPVDRKFETELRRLLG